MATGCAGGGEALVSDLSDLSDKMNAPVFALTGYAVASHGIPRGFALSLWGLVRCADLPQGYARLFYGNGVCMLRWCGACV